MKGKQQLGEKSTSPSPLRIATRGSELALWQANWVRAQLEALGHSAELVLIETKGDRTQADNQPFAQMTGQGFFTKAVQDALLDGRADLAVHSHKDLPSAPFPGLEIAAVTERADPRDVLLMRPESFDTNAGILPLTEKAKVGTSAVRRQRQLLALRPDLHVAELRGNVPTRIQKLREGNYDAIVLAAAGLARLDLDLADVQVVPLEPETFMPAPAQGALALETRRDAYDVAALLTDLHDIESYKTVAAERGLMSMLQGGCQLALGAYARLQAGTIKLMAWYEGSFVEVEHPSSEGAALLAFDALGRPQAAREAAE